jgi:hypothetical protein
MKTFAERRLNEVMGKHSPLRWWTKARQLGLRMNQHCTSWGSCSMTKVSGKMEDLAEAFHPCVMGAVSQRELILVLYAL